MSIIENKVRKAFTDFNEHNDLHKLVIEVAIITDYSVRCMSHMQILTSTINAIKKEQGGSYDKQNGTGRGSSTTPCTKDFNY